MLEKLELIREKARGQQYEKLKGLDEDMKEILKALEKYPDGINKNKLYKDVEEFMSRPTFWKKLKKLIDLKLVEQSGGGKKGKKVLVRRTDIQKKMKEIIDEIWELRYLFEAYVTMQIMELEKQAKGKTSEIDEIKEISKNILRFEELIVRAIIWRAVARLSPVFHEEVEKIIRNEALKAIGEVWDISFAIESVYYPNNTLPTTFDVLKEIEKVREKIMAWLNSDVDEKIREYFLERLDIPKG